ncbi:MAG: 8-amino-7-oxononanoate synthase [Bacteroidota bacterium]
MKKFEGRILEREIAGNLRSLQTRNLPYDFVSNDYLGLARSEELFNRIQYRHQRVSAVNKNGSSGSRLLSGNSSLAEKVENDLAAHFNAERALLFNSGYNANLAIVSSIAGQGDTILYDQLSHVCLKEGAWMSKAESRPFRHNDVKDLEIKLKQVANQGEVFVVIESVYSMDGDIAPVEQIHDVCRYYGANLIVDEAHSTGVMGKHGNGYLNEIGYSDKVFARVHTFGKAMGVHGACVCGSETLIKYLVNFARPFVYTTAMPIHSVISIEQAFEYLFDYPELNDQLLKKIDLFRKEIDQCQFGGEAEYPSSVTCIQPLIISGNERIKEMAADLQNDGFDVRPILAPTVKQGAERLRISLHTHNTDEEIRDLVQKLKSLI